MMNICGIDDLFEKRDQLHWIHIETQRLALYYLWFIWIFSRVRIFWKDWPFGDLGSIHRSGGLRTVPNERNKIPNDDFNFFSLGNLYRLSAVGSRSKRKLSELEKDYYLEAVYCLDYFWRNNRRVDVHPKSTLSYISWSMKKYTLGYHRLPPTIEDNNSSDFLVASFLLIGNRRLIDFGH